MTWKEWKKEVEEQGITDETELGYIDTSTFYHPKAILINTNTNKNINTNTNHCNIVNGKEVGNEDDEL